MSGASRRSPKWRLLLGKYAPFLFTTCPSHNKHWRTDTICICVRGCNGSLFAVRQGSKWFEVRGRVVEWFPIDPWY